VFHNNYFSIEVQENLTQTPCQGMLQAHFNRPFYTI